MTRSTCVDSCGDVFPRDPLNEPRVIQQFTSIFLVSKCDELWRVYDCATPDGADRQMPSEQSTSAYRLFLALARKSEVRVHTFAVDATHAVDAKTLQSQLDESRRM